MPHLLILGQGYTGTRLRAAMEREGWTVNGTGRTARPGILAADDPAVADAIAAATHILSSVPPETDHDPVLARHGAALAPSGAWLGYLSSTGVYGDTAGAWVDETSPVGHGRRSARTAADLAWQGIGARVLRLPGIYGPGRSALDRVREGKAQRIDAGAQVFSRIHVDDIAAAIGAALAIGYDGVVNVTDDEPAAAEEVNAYAARLMGVPAPPAVPYTAADLSPMARSFYDENKRVRNARLKHELGVRLAFPTYREGLAAMWSRGDWRG